MSSRSKVHDPVSCRHWADTNASETPPTAALLARSQQPAHHAHAPITTTDDCHRHGLIAASEQRCVTPPIPIGPWNLAVGCWRVGVRRGIWAWVYGRKCVRSRYGRACAYPRRGSCAGENSRLTCGRMFPGSGLLYARGCRSRVVKLRIAKRNPPRVSHAAAGDGAGQWPPQSGCIANNRRGMSPRYRASGAKAGRLGETPIGHPVPPFVAADKRCTALKLPHAQSDVCSEGSPGALPADYLTRLHPSTHLSDPIRPHTSDTGPPNARVRAPPANDADIRIGDGAGMSSATNASRQMRRILSYKSMTDLEDATESQAVFSAELVRPYLFSRQLGRKQVFPPIVRSPCCTGGGGLNGGAASDRTAAAPRQYATGPRAFEFRILYPTCRRQPPPADPGR